MAKIQSEIIVAIIAAVVAVAVWRVARNPQLAVLAIAMLYVVARSVIARAFQEQGARSHWSINDDRRASGALSARPPIQSGKKTNYDTPKVIAAASAGSGNNRGSASDGRADHVGLFHKLR